MFVEDAAVVFDELAVVARPGAAARRGETEAVAAALARHRPLARIEAPGTLDGGDVLRVGRRVFVGRSGRTDRSGREQLRALVAPHGYTVEEVAVTGCLHLKSAATEVAPGTLVVERRWLDAAPFAGLELIDVDPAEPFAANALRVGGAVVLPEAFPRTRRRLEARGLEVRTVPASELAKAEGGVTCCSIVVGTRAVRVPGFEPQVTAGERATAPSPCCSSPSGSQADRSEDRRSDPDHGATTKKTSAARTSTFPPLRRTSARPR